MVTKVLRANAASCLIFGALFLIAPGAVAGFLGRPPGWLIAALGAVLLMNGAHLLWAARRGARQAELLYFALGDGAWVAGTLLLILSGTWITTTGGVLAALAVAVAVGSFGVLQWQSAIRPGAQKSKSG